MDTEAGREDARRRVIAAMSARNWNVADLAREAKVDVGTAGDFVAGKRWPQRSTQAKIDVALGWWPGSISYYAREQEPPATEAEDETVSDQPQDADVLLSLPPGAFDGLSEADREEAIAAAKATLLERAREIRRRLDS